MKAQLKVRIHNVRSKEWFKPLATLGTSVWTYPNGDFCAYAISTTILCNNPYFVCTPLLAWLLNFPQHRVYWERTLSYHFRRTLIRLQYHQMLCQLKQAHKIIAT